MANREERLTAVLRMSSHIRCLHSALKYPLDSNAHGRQFPWARTTNDEPRSGKTEWHWGSASRAYQLLMLRSLTIFVLSK